MQNQINFLRAFIVVWDEITGVDDGEADQQLSAMYNQWLDRNELPHLSADELIIAIEKNLAVTDE